MYDKFIIKLYNFRTNNLLMTLSTRSQVLFFSRIGNRKREKEERERERGSARKERMREKRKLVGRETGARSRKLAAMLFPVSLFPLPPPTAPACMHRTITRYRPLHFSSSRVSAMGVKEVKNERELKRDTMKEKKRERERGWSCARGKIKSLSDAPL